MLSFITLVMAVMAAVIGQVPQNPNDLSFVGSIALVAMPAIAGLLAMLAYDGLQTIIPFYDRLPAQVHQVAAPVLGFLFGWVIAHLGLNPVESIAGVDYAWFNATLTTLAMGGIFRYLKRKAPIDATVALESTRASTSIARGA